MTSTDDTTGRAEQVRTDLLGLCRGSYQRDLVRGNETWSGSTLAGKARQYGGRYKRSRDEMEARIRDYASAHGLTCEWRHGNAAHGPRVLVLVDDSGTDVLVVGRGR